MNDAGTTVGLTLLLLLTVSCILLFWDNVKLRAAIKEVLRQKDDLSSQLRSSIERQAELVSVLKFVMQGEIRTAINDEREKIFSEALYKLNEIERHVVINNNLTQEKRDGGLNVSGGSVDVKGDAIGGNERKV